MEEQYLNAKEAADFLRIKLVTLYQLTYKRVIPFYKPAKKLYFKKSELQRYIDKGKQV